ncbi:hypothetical protein [Blautia stercoris]|nr:hypothetical protein [Blautia stercoris]
MGEKSVNPAETVVAKENKKAYNRPVIDKMDIKEQMEKERS